MCRLSYFVSNSNDYIEKWKYVSASYKYLFGALVKYYDWILLPILNGGSKSKIDHKQFLQYICTPNDDIKCCQSGRDLEGRGQKQSNTFTFPTTLPTPQSAP